MTTHNLFIAIASDYDGTGQSDPKPTAEEAILQLLNFESVDPENDIITIIKLTADKPIPPLEIETEQILDPITNTYPDFHQCPACDQWFTEEPDEDERCPGCIAEDAHRATVEAEERMKSMRAEE